MKNPKVQPNEVPTRLYVIAADQTHFEAFKRALRARGEYENILSTRLVWCRTVADLRLNTRYDIVLVGPFWTARDWSGMCEVIIERCAKKFVSIQWFPHPVQAQKAVIIDGAVIG